MFLESFATFAIFVIRGQWPPTNVDKGLGWDVNDGDSGDEDKWYVNICVHLLVTNGDLRFIALVYSVNNIWYIFTLSRRQIGNYVIVPCFVFLNFNDTLSMMLCKHIIVV